MLDSFLLFLSIKIKTTNETYITSYSDDYFHRINI